MIEAACHCVAVRIRPARPHEAGALPAIERSAGALFASLPDLAWIAGHELTPAEFYGPLIVAGSVWVAESPDAGLVGFVAAETVLGVLHVWELAVHGAFQQRGLGRRLMTAAVDHARALGLEAVTLTTFRDVAWNAPFYESLGFEIADERTLAHRLSDILRGEVVRGLPGERRCAMRLSL
ncbi:MAG: GNAT family N-acetyltransferase [Caulobacteraceae bacterium]|nr:GNAT family N-acetyltransferase [Caulobacteraceae bacterium]